MNGIKVQNFGDRLNILLRRKKLTNKEVGEKIGVSGMAVGKWIRNGDIEYHNLRGLADLLGVNWVWLRYGEDAFSDLSLDKRSLDKANIKQRERINSIKANEERVRLATDVAGIGTWDLNLQNNELIWSDSTCRIFGIAPNEFNNDIQDFFAIVHPDDLNDLIAAYEGHISNHEKQYDFNHRIIRKDGRIRWVREAGQVQLDDESRPQRMIGIVVDITETIVHNSQNDKSHVYQSLFNNQNHVAVIEFDASLNIVDWNGGAEALFGISKSEAIGKSAYEVLLPPNDEKTEKCVREVHNGLLTINGGDHSVNSNITSSGEIIQCEWFNSPILNMKGQVKCIVSLVSKLN
jgi:PAS domain S-box-containing protein